jgi:hypothetical protein
MKYLFTISLIIVLTSCGKRDAPAPFYFDETGCSNPWDSYYQSDTFSLEALRESIEVYFQDENIPINSVDFDFDSSKIELCYACHCTTGRIIVVNAPRNQKRKMKQLGFYK